MIGNRGRLHSAPKVVRRLAPASLGAMIGLVIGAAPAAQARPAPNPEFEPFADCPVTVKHVSQCLVATTTSGEFQLANKTVPITKPIVLQGGTVEGTHVLVPAADGNTLSRTPLTVPGGLTGIEGLPLGGEVIAVTELAGPVEVFAENLTGRGPAVKLPVRVKLENPILGEACYVGSEAEPILLQLTTGTTKPPPPAKPISGNPGTASLNPALTIITISGTSLVDNTFSAPAVSGCGGALLSPLLDTAVDLQVGLPAASGASTAVLNGSLEETSAREVKKAKVLPKKAKAVSKTAKAKAHG